MSDPSGKPADIDPLLVSTLANPARVAILEYLTREREEAGVSRSDLAAALGLRPLGFRYHLEVLEGVGLIARLDREGRRQATPATRRLSGPGGNPGLRAA
jgi:DNA-binding transcriptional ArsR family regulator